MNESTISSAEMSISTPLARVWTMRAGKVVLKRQRKVIVHVHLDGHQQELTDPDDRNRSTTSTSLGARCTSAIVLPI